jgi:hypothetical protein
MTAKEIQALVGVRQVLLGHNPVCENINPFGVCEMDVLSLSRSGLLYEFEVKIRERQKAFERENDNPERLFF